MLFSVDTLEELHQTFNIFSPFFFSPSPSVSFFTSSLDVYNLKEDAAIFTGKRPLISFLSWLDYCDQLIKEAQKVLKQH